MVTEFEFPDVGEGVTEGVLVKWLVSEGDEVEEDESLAEVETDKAVVEVPSPVHGTVLELKAEEGDTIKVGNVIVTLGEEGEEPSGETGEEEEEPEETSEEEEPEDAGDEDTGGEEEEESGGSTSVVGELEDADAKAEGETEEAEGEDKPEEKEETDEDKADPADTGEERSNVLAAPSTRKLAREEGVDITTLSGSGPGGRVTKEDVEAAAGDGTGQQPGTGETETAAPAPGGTFGSSGRRFEPEDRDFGTWGDVEREELSPTRKSIAKRMERSAYTAPHVTSTDDADVTELVKVREQEKKVAEEEGVHLTYLPFVVKAVISALRDYPRLNASLDERTGELVKKDYHNIGVAVATDDGLLVPNIKDADQKSILTIAGEIEELAEKARNREISIDEMRGGTFTITNWGSIGGKYGTPIINYPEVGILGTGVIDDEVKMVDGNLQVRKVMPLSLSFDHRVVDGAYAAQFMNELVTHLEDPNLLMMD